MRGCTICHHPQRLDLERTIISGTPLRDIAGRFGTSKSSVARHRGHIRGTIEQVSEIREAIRVTSLLEDVRAGESRADRLYRHAEAILSAALEDNDRGSALNAVRTAVSVLAEARGYMALRGELTQELGRERTFQPTFVQILSPASGSSVEQLPLVKVITEEKAMDGLAIIGLP